MSVLSTITTSHGLRSSKSQRHSTRKCLRRLSSNLKKSSRSCRHQSQLTLFLNTLLRSKRSVKTSQRTWMLWKEQNCKKSMFHMRRSKESNSISMTKKCEIGGAGTSEQWASTQLANSQKQISWSMASVHSVCKSSRRSSSAGAGDWLFATRKISNAKTFQADSSINKKTSERRELIRLSKE